jgi:hypothetical protein
VTDSAFNFTWRRTNLKTSRYVETLEYVRKYDIRVAMVLGDRAATFIQQVHYRTAWKDKKYGTTEWRSSLSEWNRTFPFWSVDTIKRIITDCKEKQVLITRKEKTYQGVAIWFSLDYDVLDRIGDEGQKMLDDLGASAKCTDPEVQIAHDPQCKMHFTPVQNAQHLLKQSTKALSTTDKSSEASPSLSTKQKMDEKFKRNRIDHVSSFRKRFDANHSSTAVIDFWKVISIEHFGKEGYMPIVKDTKVMRIIKSQFVPWCEEAGVHTLEFLEWCISHWVELRDTRIKWPKLSTHPTFMEIYNHRDTFLSQYRRNGGSENAVTGNVYTSVDQIPKEHPLHAQLKRLVEKTGRAETL